MQTMMSETTGKGVDKTKRYGWVTKDAPGELRNLHKDALQIHPAYQRDVLPMKVKEITGSWSWAACGAIVVGERGGEFWVIDGQHRRRPLHSSTSTRGGSRFLQSGSSRP